MFLTPNAGFLLGGCLYKINKFNILTVCWGALLPRHASCSDPIILESLQHGD